MEEGTKNVMNPHDKMRARSVSPVATGQQAPRPAHEPGTIADAPPLMPDLTNESGRVELKTTPLDARFPFANHTRHSYARYRPYHLCIKETGGESGECEKFAHYYRSLCPTDWIMEWNRQREGIFQVGQRFLNYDWPITFDKHDYGDVRFPHNDAIVLSLKISPSANDSSYSMSRILVDTGSSVDILYKSTFDKLGFRKELLSPSRTRIIGITGNVLHPLGAVELYIQFGNPPQTQSLSINFLVVEGYSAYNAIVGRPTLNRLKAIISTTYLMIKFPTPHGVGVERTDQQTSRQCHSMALQRYWATQTRAPKPCQL